MKSGGGVPAIKLKNRFEKDIVDRLLKLRWWNWSEEKIMAAKSLFCQELNLETLKQFEEIGKMDL